MAAEYCAVARIRQQLAEVMRQSRCWERDGGLTANGSGAHCLEPAVNRPAGHLARRIVSQLSCRSATRRSTWPATSTSTTSPRARSRERRADAAHSCEPRGGLRGRRRGLPASPSRRRPGRCCGSAASSLTDFGGVDPAARAAACGSRASPPRRRPSPASSWAPGSSHDPRPGRRGWRHRQTKLHRRRSSAGRPKWSPCLSAQGSGQGRARRPGPRGLHAGRRAAD